MVRTALVIGFTLVLSIDCLLPSHDLRALFFGILRLSITDLQPSIQKSLTIESLLITWTILSITLVTYSFHESGMMRSLFYGMPLLSSSRQDDNDNDGSTVTGTSVKQRTFTFPDSLAFNYFDPDNVPDDLNPYAETVFQVAQSLSHLHGFQIDNSRNQSEHLLMLLYNETKSSDDMVSRPAQRLHQQFFGNYYKWCSRMGVRSNLLRNSDLPKSFEHLLEDSLMYLLIWGEAANLKHMPECICFLLHKALEENLTFKAQYSGASNVSIDELTTTVPGRYPGFYLDMVVTPLYEVVAESLKGHGDHRLTKTYDDFNEFFWDPQCLLYSVHSVENSLDSAEQGDHLLLNNKVRLVSSGLKGGSKTYLEKRSWLHPLLSMSRVFEWHVITFTLLTTWAYANLLVWTYAFTLQVGSFIFLEITFLGIIWTALEVWTLFPSVKVSEPSLYGYLVRLLIGVLILTYQTIYYHWSFIPDSSTPLDSVPLFHDFRQQNEHQFQMFWWWQYIWLSLLSCSLYLLESLLCWCPGIVTALMTWDNEYVQALLTVCYPMSQLYVGKATNIPQREVLVYIFFWVTLLSFKLWFGYRYITSPVSIPSLLLYDDYVNYYGGPDAISFLTTSTLLFGWWFPHFLVYLIDLSIWYAVWASLFGGFIAIIDRQGAVRESVSFRSHFMRAPIALCQKMLSKDSNAAKVSSKHISTISLSNVGIANASSSKAKESNNVKKNLIKNSSRARSSADLMNFDADEIIVSSSTTDVKGHAADSSPDKMIKGQAMLQYLDIRSQRWVIFAKIWNEIINKLRASDFMSNAEKDMFVFTYFDWLSKPVYLPLFQTAGLVGYSIVAYKEMCLNYHKENDNESKMLILEKFHEEHLTVIVKESISEVWELASWVLIKLMGSTHLKDMERIVTVFYNWAASDDLLSRLNSECIDKVITYLSNIISILKSCVNSRKKSPTVTPEFLLRHNYQQSQDLKLKTKDFSSVGTSNGVGSIRVKKSVSTGFLSALGGSNLKEESLELKPNVGTTQKASQIARQYQKLEPLRISQVLVDTTRDKIRDEVRNLFTVLRGGLKTKVVHQEGQDLIDRVVFILNLESGFVWNDIYASAQIDDLAADSRVLPVLNKLNGLLKLRVTQVELKSREANRRLNFFMNSLFMDIPSIPTTRYCKEYTTITPYYSEDILLTKETLQSKNSDGVSTMLYLQTLFKEDWLNYLERRSITDEQQVWSNKEIQSLRMWASNRAQTLYRTVEGMMHTEAAVRLFCEIEQLTHTETDLLCKMKFNYVVACQVYGSQKKSLDSKADDIEFMLHKYPNLRVAYIDTVRPRKGDQSYYSVLIKSDPSVSPRTSFVPPVSSSSSHHKDLHPVKEVYRIKLPGNPILGEGKPENQNHAIIFTRGRYLQAIDMNQDGYFEESLKMRNLLEEFDSGCVILGFREHIFTGSVSSVANYMALQELSFVTLGQRVLNQPLRIRQHYGHPDLFKKTFVMTEGGMSKASHGINLSEDVFAGFNATIRGHTVNFKEYVQVGKGRDVGLQQTYKFEAKLSQGNAEQCLSRDMNRICNRLDFFRLMSFYYGGIGHYIANTMVIFTLMVVVYINLIIAVYNDEGVNGRPLKPEGLLQLVLAGMGLLQTLPLIVTLTVEKGIFSALSEIGFMILSGGPLYFIFHIETKCYYFAQTLMAGGAMYRPTGRGFVIAHSSFDENFRFFASSHIYLGFELAFALILFGVYTTSTQYYGVTWSLWLAAISFTIGPFWFNPLSFEWNRIKDDYMMWISWMNELGGTSEQSWEAWWKEENRYFYDLSTSWKVCLFIQKFFVWMVVAYGIGGKSILTSQDDQNCMLKVLTVFVLFFFSNWVLHKLERTWTYAVRRVTRLIIWITMLSTLILLFINHVQYIRFTIATYYLIAALVYLFLLCNCHNQVIVVYKVHDYIIGHAIFLLLSVLALCQVSDIHRAPFLLVIDFMPYLRIQ